MNTRLNIWRYYLKMLRYEPLLIPAALLVLCLALLLLMKAGQTPDVTLNSIANAFVEAGLPLATALMATSWLLNDPLLELHYTMPRPFGRTVLEKIGFLLLVMTGFYGLFSIVIRLIGIPLLGWAASPYALLIWLAPACGWVGLTLALSTLLQNGVAGSGLVALLWLLLFLVRAMLDSATGRLLYPFLTVFQPDSGAWVANRLVLLLIGLVGSGLSLRLLQNGESYFKPDA